MFKKEWDPAKHKPQYFVKCWNVSVGKSELNMRPPQTFQQKKVCWMCGKAAKLVRLSRGSVAPVCIIFLNKYFMEIVTHFPVISVFSQPISGIKKSEVTNSNSICYVIKNPPPGEKTLVFFFIFQFAELLRARLSQRFFKCIGVVKEKDQKKAMKLNIFVQIPC